MKILWLSPWMRPLARIHADALRSVGHDVRIVTSDQHPESGPARDDEWVLDPRPKQASTYRPFWRVQRAVGAYSPDVVVSELVRDPRWISLAAGPHRVSTSSTTTGPTTPASSCRGGRRWCSTAGEPGPT